MVRYSTWWSRGEVAQQRRGASGPVVIEGHEGVVEDERRPLLLGHLANQAEARREVDLVERAPRQLLHGHPVAGFRGPDPEGEVELVDLRPAGIGRR